MRSNNSLFVVTAFLLGIIFGISTVSATADNRNAELLNTDMYQIPELQFDPSQQNIIVNEGLRPDLEEQVTKSSLSRTVAKSSTASIIPKGSIIHHSKDGITTVFDHTGKQILAANDSQAKLVPTPAGKIPATHIYTVPSGSYEYYSENATYVINNNEIVLVKQYEKSNVDFFNSISRLSKESSESDQKFLKSYTVETDQINSTMMAYAGIDNPAFSPGQTYSAQWIVPDPPHQSGNVSPTYVSIGLDEMNSYYGYTSWHNFRPIIEYDYEQNAWLMSACSYNRYYIWNWDALCTDKFLIHSGDKIEGRIEYREDTSSSPTQHQIYAYIMDYNTGLGISSGSGYPVNTDNISQLSINLQGDLESLNESTIIGNTTFSPVKLPALPTTFADTSNSQLPNMNVENLWPEKIVFHTRYEPKVVAKTYSITNAWVKPQENPPFEPHFDSKKYLDTLNRELINEGWIQAFPEINGTNLKKAQFGVYPTSSDRTIDDATLHWHIGHGTGKLNGTHTSLALPKTYNSSIGDFDLDFLTPSEVTTKWGGNNKWVVLLSCWILQDPDWGSVLGVSHGIFGFTTPTDVKAELPSKFLQYAKSGNTLYDSWYSATNDLYYDDVVGTEFITGPDGKARVDNYNHTVNVSAALRFKTKEQLDNDHLPGIGKNIAPDGDPNDLSSIGVAWDCHTGERVYS